MIATLIMAGSGKGAAAASVILHRTTNAPGAGLAGLLIFVLCMAIVAFAWTRLRGNRSGT